MARNHVYVLGINAYDHDVSACLLRDGEIAFAINKERITRKKHDGGFYHKAVEYCLAAEGISLDDSIWWCATATFCRSRIWNCVCYLSMCPK
jgi:carbamoyltransferase